MKIFIKGTWYKIKSKKEIYSDFFQEILKRTYSLKKKTEDSDKEFIKCGCNVRLYTAKSGQFLTIRSYPKQSEYHRPECVFSKYNSDSFFDYEDKNGGIKIKTEKIFKMSNKKEELKIFMSAFNHLAMLVVENAYCTVFNKINVGIDRLKEYKNLSMPKIDDVTQFVKNDFLSLQVENTTVKKLLESLGYEMFVNIAKINKIKEDLIEFETSKKHVFSIGKKLVYWFSKNAPVSLEIKENSWYLLLVIREKATKKYIRFYMMQVSNKEGSICFVEGEKERYLVSSSKGVWFKNLLGSSVSKVLTKEYLYKYFQIYENRVPSLVQFSETINFYDSYGNIIFSINQKTI